MASYNPSCAQKSSAKSAMENEMPPLRSSWWENHDHIGKANPIQIKMQNILKFQTNISNW